MTAVIYLCISSKKYIYIFIYMYICFYESLFIMILISLSLVFIIKEKVIFINRIIYSDIQNNCYII
ncbi:hypothetical protein PFDG_01839 [Plasmodium falciparum Dd2]|uniref:Uncharacterized protein n=1 Tax=Plasmodium falciparum (isolate Dd2) TaxID=57267 RepID=A0A0L7M0E0_PLAF4|nr:hypothetical protein PFDG_01839 [Plasmodium falciparum Dd2]